MGDLERRLELASVIIVISVLVILLTAPVGAIAVMLGGPRLLNGPRQSKESAAKPEDSSQRVEAV